MLRNRSNILDKQVRGRIGNIVLVLLEPAPEIPFPDPLVIRCLRLNGAPNPADCRSGVVGVEVECSPVAKERAPVDYAHEVHKTENCEQVLYDDVTEGDCPPGDWRDVLLLSQEAFEMTTVEKKRQETAHLVPHNM